jgi:hypothetical protein
MRGVQGRGCGTSQGGPKRFGQVPRHNEHVLEVGLSLPGMQGCQAGKGQGGTSQKEGGTAQAGMGAWHGERLHQQGMSMRGL